DLFPMQWAAAINNHTQIVGNGSTADGKHTYPALFSAGQLLNLGNLGGTDGGANAINDDGHVVGTSYTGQFVNGRPVYHAFFYDGAIHDVGTLGGSSSDSSAALAINNSDQIFGWSTINGDPNTYHAFLYSG